MSKQTKKPAKPRKAGRPKGTKKQTYPEVDNVVSACTKCQSTNRTPYTTRTVVAQAGENNGQIYNSVIFQRTSCVDCGQHRIDRSYLFDPQK